ncbi:MAG: ATP phosphoribosyltransferase [Chloroflexi bacterium]|nr:ATP phosphoribosyltransferase [Chloroflexota bacterium]
MVLLALPTRALEQDTLAFLKACGLEVRRPNPRQYTATVSTMPGLEVVFQRAVDVYDKVEEGSADLGITGLDIVHEREREGGNVLVIYPNLGFGRCTLALAAPESWVDVMSVADLAELAAALRERGRKLRVATKYPNMAQQFLTERGVTDFTLVESQGVIEAAPRMGYADVICDIVETGITLRENGLKLVTGGVVLESSACFIGNRRNLREQREKLDSAKRIIELFEARLRAQSHYQLTAYVPAATEAEVAEKIAGQTGLQAAPGPTIARVYASTQDGRDWYAATVIAQADALVATIERLRAAGGRDIAVTPVEYLFEESSTRYRELLRQLQLKS